jgi:hypothetical protein
MVAYRSACLNVGKNPLSAVFVQRQSPFQNNCMKLSDLKPHFAAGVSVKSRVNLSQRRAQLDLMSRKRTQR